MSSFLKELLVCQFLVRLAWGQCYLEDTSASCAVCWATSSDGSRASYPCPAGSVKVRWDTPLPENMIADVDYKAAYTLEVDPEVFEVVPTPGKSGIVHVPHSNVHSCITTQLACTPFVSNSPGLSTHTAALSGNLSGSMRPARTFHTNVALPTASYTIIVHNRFYVRDPNAGNCSDCLTKIDTAVGTLRTVVDPEVTTSPSAYVAAGGAAVAMLAVIVVVMNSKALRLEELITLMMVEEVSLVGDIFISVGDIWVFTVAFQNEMVNDDFLQDVVPAGFLLLFLGWLTSIVAGCHRLKRLRDAVFRRQGWMDKRYDEIRAETRLAISTLATFMLGDLPICGLCVYAMLQGSAVRSLTVASMCVSSLWIGIKVNAMLNFKERRREEKLQAARNRAIMRISSASFGPGVPPKVPLEEEDTEAANREEEDKACEAKKTLEELRMAREANETIEERQKIPASLRAPWDLEQSKMSREMISTPEHHQNPKPTSKWANSLNKAQPQGERADADNSGGPPS